MRNSQSFAILIWANKAKADNKGYIPVYARVTVMGKRAEISLKKKVNSQKWDGQSGLLKGSGEEVRTINNQLAEIKNTLWKIYTDKLKCEEYISANEIKDHYLGTKKEHRSLLEVFDEHNLQMKELVGKDVVQATLTKYNTIRGKVAAFIKHQYGKPDMLLENLEYSFITGFEHYLKTVEGVEHNTTMSYIKRVKRIITISINNKWLSHNPFASFKCPYKRVEREELSWDELVALANYEFKIQRLDEVRDVFLFCCYTGYAFVDVEKLTPENIVKGNNGGLWVRNTRTKTEIPSNVPLLPQATAIIKKYRDSLYSEIKNKLLPVKSNQKMNAYLKEIGDLCSIKKNLTTHMARHTFATTVTLENNVPIETISKMLGHTKITTTQIYAKAREKKVYKDMMNLKAKLATKMQKSS